MKEIIICHVDASNEFKNDYFQRLKTILEKHGFKISFLTSVDYLQYTVNHNSHLACVIFDWDFIEIEVFDKNKLFSNLLPLIGLTDKHSVLDITLWETELNLEFMQYNYSNMDDHIYHIRRKISEYLNMLLPPLTRHLFNFKHHHKYTFCTPGHLGGTAFQKSPVGNLFYDFYGENVFKTDISISVEQLGSLLDSSGPHREAEEFAAKVFNADRTFFITNGTSTSNKIACMYSAAEGDTIIVDRNCHKSIAHTMMMNNVIPLYLKPTRNAYGILGGIPKQEFSKQNIQAKLDNHKFANSWPIYSVITNSTYDGILYDVEYIKKTLDSHYIHFDGAWIPYAHFHAIYAGKYGMHGEATPGKVIFETQSTHKLLAAFSQASMLHIKGDYDENTMNECFMMHTTTSPLYSIVASCEIATAMMADNSGQRIMRESLEAAHQFRKELIKIKSAYQDWFFDLWQPKNIETLNCWSLKNDEQWHGFSALDNDFLFLDPIKVTVLTPGITNNQLDNMGIPAAVVAKFLDDNGVIVEKTGPYSLLFLFSIGIDNAKSMRLLSLLIKFKKAYDANLLIKEALPSLYQEHADFYEGMRLQTLCQEYHQLIKQYNLPNIMHGAFDVLPEMVVTPHHAFTQMIKGKTKLLPLKELINHTSATMILPYPPGVPLIMPGEQVTAKSKIILDYLLLLQEIGCHLPGFATSIHGTRVNDKHELLVEVLT